MSMAFHIVWNMNKFSINLSITWNDTSFLSKWNAWMMLMHEVMMIMFMGWNVSACLTSRCYRLTQNRFESFWAHNAAFYFQVFLFYLFFSFTGCFILLLVCNMLTSITLWLFHLFLWSCCLNQFAVLWHLGTTTCLLAISISILLHLPLLKLRTGCFPWIAVGNFVFSFFHCLTPLVLQVKWLTNLYAQTNSCRKYEEARPANESDTGPEKLPMQHFEQQIASGYSSS